MTSPPHRTAPQDRGRDECAADSGATLIRDDGHVLQFDLAGAGRRHELQVTYRR